MISPVLAIAAPAPCRPISVTPPLSGALDAALWPVADPRRRSFDVILFINGRIHRRSCGVWKPSPASAFRRLSFCGRFCFLAVICMIVWCWCAPSSRLLREIERRSPLQLIFLSCARLGIVWVRCCAGERPPSRPGCRLETATSQGDDEVRDEVPPFPETHLQRRPAAGACGRPAPTGEGERKVSAQEVGCGIV